ncbi:hypothetical protein ASPZODRAFT_147090 [Penicilliopsis zonata CBS 506.65]|uniref:Zn(2)-C6 fungal-type domain-containing protein n=1 Tax=Penicilliopsis zonata CBS 506.65 TaxID=1073090 RepID=A0A1L9S691_9EURO|nr:hypothetical protein ASPZODRAFT_147090 [Penicilliopsis zonata CBS 506.65]OJJ42677.1 hypothetical protein ASPZODRAFT_147090 [Penicilliopsis zonata CBS 506.65]
MRVSISCAACRQAKVKCHHDGSPPCRRCLRLRTPDCVLSDPRAAPRTPPRRAKRRAIQAVSMSLESREIPSRSPSSRAVSQVSVSQSDPVACLSPSTIISACETYRKKFPTTNFLHYPSLIADISACPSTVDPVFVAAVLALCARFMPSHGLQPEDVYADYARSQLALRAFESPSLALAQSLVMVSFYEWGSGHAYKAWMYSGMATYMIQSLLKTADDNHEATAQTQYEQLVRTYWCCFAQDCELSSGARQHFALSFQQISVPLPIADHDFIFVRPAPQRLMPADMCGGSRSLPRTLTIDHGLTLVTRGFDIFVRILRFANESRRARASSAAPAALQPSSWQTLKEELDEWRALQDVTLRYPTTNVQAHVALGSGELFAYINLIHFMSVLFLDRDRVLASYHPLSDLVHRVPAVDEPSDATDDQSTIHQLFTAAQNIGGILSALEAAETPVITPYSGFSVFVAAHINMYGTVSPQRYPGGLHRAEEETQRNFLYLDRVRQLWPVGHSWVFPFLCDWRTVQEAKDFYRMAKSTQTQNASHLTLAGRLDEYGDIRCLRLRLDSPRNPSVRRHSPVRQRSLVVGDAGRGDRTRHPSDREASTDHLPANNAPDTPLDLQDLEADMLQWPFIDGSWSLGMSTGWDGWNG